MACNSGTPERHGMNIPNIPHSRAGSPIDNIDSVTSLYYLWFTCIPGNLSRSSCSISAVLRIDIIHRPQSQWSAAVITLLTKRSIICNQNFLTARTFYRDHQRGYLDTAGGTASCATFFTGHCGLDKCKYKIHKFMYAVQIQTSILHYSLIQASHGCSRYAAGLQKICRVHGESLA